ncbi:hypothetical protein GF354_06220 [Candidatus Peregrinibacteria bacterium]|nr:hypothetical protein [Candidatus Peregrinibacteria bacterium]
MANTPANQPSQSPKTPQNQGLNLPDPSAPDFTKKTNEEIKALLEEAKKIGYEDGVKKGKESKQENTDSKNANDDQSKDKNDDKENSSKEKKEEPTTPKTFEEMTPKQIKKHLKKAGIKAKYDNMTQTELKKLVEAADVIHGTKRPKKKKTTRRAKVANYMEEANDRVEEILNFNEYHEEQYKEIEGNIKKALWELWVGFGSNIPRNLYKIIQPFGYGINDSITHPLRLFSNIARIPTSILRSAGNIVKAPFRMLDEAVAGIKGFLDTTAKANEKRNVLLSVTPELLSKVMSVPKFFTSLGKTLAEAVTSPTVYLDEYVEDIQTRE